MRIGRLSGRAGNYGPSEGGPEWEYLGSQDETMRCLDCMTPEQRRDAARALDAADAGGKWGG